MNKAIKIRWKAVKKGIIQAEEWRACEDEIEKLKQIKTLDEFIAHKGTPSWLYWYAKQLRKGRVEAFEAIISTNAFYSYMYCNYIAKHKIKAMEANIKNFKYWWTKYSELPEEVTQ